MFRSEKKTYQVKKTHIKWKKPISNHITPFIVGLLLVYCWRTAGPVLSVLLMTSVLCWSAHDVMTCFKTPDLFKMAAALLEAPLRPEEAWLKLKCIVISQASLPLRIQDEGMSRQNCCHVICAYICCYRCSSMFDRALIHARPTGNKQVT